MAIIITRVQCKRKKHLFDLSHTKRNKNGSKTTNYVEVPHKFGKMGTSKNSNEINLQMNPDMRKGINLQHHNYRAIIIPLFCAQFFKQFLWYFLPQLLHESILLALSLPSFSPTKQSLHIMFTFDWPCSSPATSFEASYRRERNESFAKLTNAETI